MASNWKEIGDEAKAKASMYWVYAGFFLIVLTVVLNLFVLPEEKSSNGLFLLYFLIWRFTAAKSQLKYVKDTFPNGYTKKGWMKPILISLSVLIVYVFFSIGLTQFINPVEQVNPDAQCYDKQGNWICE